MPSYPRLTGLIAATYTPMRPDGSLNVELIGPMVDQMVADGVGGLYVCGSTGEGPCLTDAERMAVAEASVRAAAGRVPVIVQVGSNSVLTACELAAHAAAIGADAVSAVPPMYFKPANLEILIDCVAQIAGAAPGLPFYYYHIPRLSGVSMDAREFLSKAGERVPNLAGIKYTHPDMAEYRNCLDLEEGRFDILWGSDQMMLGALAMGARGFIGSTYSFAAPHYRKLIDAFEKGDLQMADALMLKAIQLVRLLDTEPGPFLPASKQAALAMRGFDAGANRLPLPRLSGEAVSSARQALEAFGFRENGELAD